MPLTGPQVQEFHAALLSAYDAASLALMVRRRLDVDLPTAVDGSSFSNVVWNLIDWAERTGQTDEILAEAVAQMPDNAALKDFADRYKEACGVPPSEVDGSREQPAEGAAYDRGVENSVDQVHTQGGAYIVGDVNTGGGDLIGRDKVVQGDEVYGNKVVYQQVLSASELRDRNNRLILREMVTEYWIKGVLENSLEHEAAIRLGLTDRSGMVENRPWRVIPVNDKTDHPLPSGTSIIDVFDQMGQRMLILGEPGSGKTTMLLELARELIERVDETPALPSPVVFNLSSWIQQRAPLADWLVEELRTRYSIPKKMAQAWIEQDKLLLLLDGLDEVQSEYRSHCVEAVNLFLQDHLVPLAVCSRVAEYEGLSVRLRLRGAVLLQPLSAEQIELYLNRAGPALSAVHIALHDDVELSELAKSPLMLSIMALAYQGVSSTELALTATTPTRRQHVFGTYIQRMFTRREAKPSYSPRQTVQWLRWLSARLIEYGQTVFLIERMQPNWLQSTDQPAYPPYSMLLMLLAGPLYGLGFGLSGALIFQLSVGLITLLLGDVNVELIGGLSGDLIVWLRAGLRSGVVFGLIGWLILGQSVGLTFGLIDGVSGGFKHIYPLEHSSVLTDRLKSSLLAALFWALSFGLVFGLSSWLRFGMITGLRTGLGFGLVGGLVGGLIGGLIEIEPVRKVKLKSNLSFGLRFTLIVWLVVGLCTGLMAWLGSGLHGGLHEVLRVWLREGLVGGVIGGLVFGFIFQPYAKKSFSLTRETRIPNQGIWSSAQYAAMTSLMVGLIVGLIIGLGVGLIVGLIVGLGVGRGVGVTVGLSAGLGFALIGWLIGGLIFGLTGGGDVVMKHCLLRTRLWRLRHIPWNYARFLDYATGLIFLRKVGGGYIFVHRMIMEHFATLSEEDIERIVAPLEPH